jgi:hypothetical protein
MKEPLPIYCSRCPHLATLDISASSDKGRRSATSCDSHRGAVRRWVSFVGSPEITPIDQPLEGQLALFPVTEVEP